MSSEQRGRVHCAEMGWTENPMARLTAQLRLPPLPSEAELIPLQQQLDIDFAGPSGLAASGSHAGWGYTTKLVISWHLPSLAGGPGAAAAGADGAPALRSGSGCGDPGRLRPVLANRCSGRYSTPEDLWTSLVISQQNRHGQSQWIPLQVGSGVSPALVEKRQLRERHPAAIRLSRARSGSGELWGDGWRRALCGGAALAGRPRTAALAFAFW